MKRIILYIVILAGVLAIPVKRLDVAKLRPVQVVSIYTENNWLVMETDTGDKGFGGTARQALQNLKDTSSGIIYLDTADYLLLTDETMDTAEELRQELKDTVRLCLTAKKVNLAEASKFLSVHGKLPRLSAWENGQELPVLSTFGDSLIFLKKVENRA